MLVKELRLHFRAVVLKRKKLRVEFKHEKKPTNIREEKCKYIIEYTVSLHSSATKTVTRHVLIASDQIFLKIC